MQLSFATRKVKQHESALRRGVGGDRKAPDSPPQRRNPCNEKDQQQEAESLPLLVGRAHLARQC